MDAQLGFVVERFIVYIYKKTFLSQRRYVPWKKYLVASMSPAQIWIKKSGRNCSTDFRNGFEHLQWECDCTLVPCFFSSKTTRLVTV